MKEVGGQAEYNSQMRATESILFRPQSDIVAGDA